MQEAVISKQVYAGLLSNALSSLKDLKSSLHSYNKKLAKVRYNLMWDISCGGLGCTAGAFWQLLLVGDGGGGR